MSTEIGLRIAQEMRQQIVAVTRLLQTDQPSARKSITRSFIHYETRGGLKALWFAGQLSRIDYCALSNEIEFFVRREDMRNEEDRLREAS